MHSRARSSTKSIAKLAPQRGPVIMGRMQEEIKRQGVGAAATYLNGEFTRLKQEFTRELSTATSD